MIHRVEAPSAGLTCLKATGHLARGVSKELQIENGFRVASMSRTPTGILAMQLVEQGRLALEAPLTEFLDVNQMPVMA